MAHKNGYSLQISTNNQPLKIVENYNNFKTSILNGSKYSLDLSNNNSFPVDAYLKIDGKKMGSYRIIPRETITIIRPIRRKKDLCFLKKTEDFAKQKLLKKTNEKLGEIEVLFRSGVKYDSDEEDIRHQFNKQVYRLEDYDFDSKYMNKYKRIKRERIIGSECCIPKLETEPEECCELEILQEPICCIPKLKTKKYWKEESAIDFEEPLPIPNNELDTLDIEYVLNISNGFTAYGDDITSKYKTYQALDYDSEETKIVIKI